MLEKKTPIIYISEIFGPTIQGEGPDIGSKCIFLRVAGCDFRCNWCDSKYTWSVSRSKCKGYKEEDLLECTLDLCKNTNTSHVILTGGNPCIYNFSSIISGLHKSKIKVDIETQGSILPNWLINCDLIVISPKPPSSGQKDIFEIVKFFVLENADIAEKIVIKIPIFNKEDIVFLKKYYDEFKNLKVRIYCSVGNNMLGGNNKNIVTESLNAYRNLIDEVFKTNMESIHILPQMHVLLWGNKRGV